MTRICIKCNCERELDDFVLYKNNNGMRRKNVCVYCQSPLIVDDYVVKKKDKNINGSNRIQVVIKRVEQLEEKLNIHPFPKFKHTVKHLKEVI